MARGRKTQRRRRGGLGTEGMLDSDVYRKFEKERKEDLQKFQESPKGLNVEVVTRDVDEPVRKRTMSNAAAALAGGRKKRRGGKTMKRKHSRKH
jgi:hypothetical protein